MILALITPFVSRYVKKTSGFILPLQCQTKCAFTPSFLSLSFLCACFLLGVTDLAPEGFFILGFILPGVEVRRRRGCGVRLTSPAVEQSSC